MTATPPNPETRRTPPGETPSAATGTPTGAGDIPFASPRAGAVTSPSAPSAWGGVRHGDEPTLADRVVTYDLDATLDPKKHTVDGKERLTWRNRSDREVRSVFLHLYLNAFEGPGSTFMTENRERGFGFRSDVPTKDGEWGHIELTKVQQGGATVPWRFVHPDGGPDSDHTVVRLDLPAPVPAGGSTTLDIDFHDQLPRVVARTGYFGTFHLVAQWYPKIGVLELAGERGAMEPRWNVHEFHLHSEFYADFGQFDARLRVPKSFTVGATGEEQGAPEEKDGLVVHHFVQGDVHDFAWTADDHFAPPLEGTYEGPGSPVVKVRVLYPPEYRASAAPALKATIDSLRYFSETLGPYPYRTATCVLPPFNATEAGGMEYPTFFTSIGLDEVEPNTLSQIAVEFVTIHEFGHGYFYGLLASNEFEEPMLDEGLNETWDMRMLEARGESAHLTTPLLRAIGIGPVLHPFEFERIGGGLDPHPPDPISANSWDRLSSDSYGTVYSRTATTFHDLEQRLGPEAFARAFKAYYARWHFRHPSIADLRESLAQASGDRQTVEEVFTAHVYGVSPIDDRVEALRSDEVVPLPGTYYRDGKWVEETSEAVHKQIAERRAAWRKEHPDAKPDVAGPYPFRTAVTLRRDGAVVPQTLVVSFADGSRETVRWEGSERWRRFTWVKPAKAMAAEIDPERKIYLDYNKLNDGRRLEPDGVASRRYTSDFAALMQLAFSLGAAL